MKLTVYHGSDHIIEKPEYGKGKKYNDYGMGFYTTEDKELVKEWAVDYDRDGYANEYELDMDGLKVLNLSSDEFSVLHWITMLIEHRKFDIDSEIASEGKKYLIKNYHIDTSEYDIIRGYRADDSYFAYAESFLKNSISVKRLGEALRLGKLGEQIVLVSPKAFEHIRYVDSFQSDATLYYPKREERNETARRAFLTNKRGSIRKDDVFLMDLIRGDEK